MKKLLISTLIAVVFSTTFLNAQTCGYYMPMKLNSGIEKKTYSGKDNLTGSYTQKIVEMTTEGAFSVSKIETENFDKKGKSSGKRTYTVKCNGNSVIIDAKSLLDPETLKAYEGMDITISCEDFEIPTNPTVNQTLKDGSASVKVVNQGMDFAAINMIITDRKFVAIESVTVPQGTYECLKLTYNISMEISIMGFPKTIIMSGVDYISSKVGSVKTETYDKNDKLISYDVLTNIF